MELTMQEMKIAIVKDFKRQYGFAPAMKNIIPLVSSGSGNTYNWMAFCIGKIGYEYNVYTGVQKSESYDL